MGIWASGMDLERSDEKLLSLFGIMPQRIGNGAQGIEGFRRSGGDLNGALKTPKRLVMGTLPSQSHS
jgi:hypothetical protein